MGIVCWLKPVGASALALVAACAAPGESTPPVRSGQTSSATQYVIPMARRDLLYRPVELGTLDPAALAHVPRVAGALVDAYGLAPSAVRFEVARGNAETVAFAGGELVHFADDGTATVPWRPGAPEAMYRIEGLVGDGSGADVALSATALPR